MTKEQEEAIEKIDKKLDTTENEEITVNLLYKKIDLLEDILKQNSAELAEKSAEIEKYKSLYNKALDNTIKVDRENIQLKKQIDLMAETIRALAISLASYEGSYNKETINFTGNIKDIEQYFERKVNSSEQN